MVVRGMKAFNSLCSFNGPAEQGIRVWTFTGASVQLSCLGGSDVSHGVTILGNRDGPQYVNHRHNSVACLLPYLPECKM